MPFNKNLNHFSLADQTNICANSVDLDVTAGLGRGWLVVLYRNFDLNSDAVQNYKNVFHPGLVLHLFSETSQ